MCTFKHKHSSHLGHLLYVAKNPDCFIVLFDSSSKLILMYTSPSKWQSGQKTHYEQHGSSVLQFSCQNLGDNSPFSFSAGLVTPETNVSLPQERWVHLNTGFLFGNYPYKTVFSIKNAFFNLRKPLGDYSRCLAPSWMCNKWLNDCRTLKD